MPYYSRCKGTVNTVRDIRRQNYAIPQVPLKGRHMAHKPTKKILAYEQFKNAIISGEIKPGEILNEAVLAEKYGMGKTPAREALLLLANEDCLDSMPRVG